MKKTLLLCGAAVVSASAYALDFPTPKTFEDAFIYAMSPNGKYAISHVDYVGVRIFDLEAGSEVEYSDGDNNMYSVGQGKCISNNGILVGSTDFVNAEYWKDGEWYMLPVPDSAVNTNLAQAISADGSRICGSIGVSGMSVDEDVLMQAPCVWNAKGDGYDDPIMLPHPALDFTGRVPQYITAIDMSADGKVIVGQITDAVGTVRYPIVYKEGANGEWSYVIPHENFLKPEGVVFPEFPGDGPIQPSQEQFMTPDELNAYIEALNKYYEAGDWDAPYPTYEEHMTDAEIAAYEYALEEYEEKHAAWYEKFNAWFTLYDECTSKIPGYVFNTVRMSPDGKTFGCTIGKNDSEGGGFFMGYSMYNVWVFDIDSEAITKYEQLQDLNLTCMANNGVVLAGTSFNADKSSAYVLHDGLVDNAYYWMSKKCLPFASWMNENMRFSYEYFEQGEDGSWIPSLMEDVLMTGRPMATPDLSVIAFSVPNVWDGMTVADAYIFDLEAYRQYEEAGVKAVAPADNENVIYDLSGRKLNSASAPGIYIINGEKKIVK